MKSKFILCALLSLALLSCEKKQAPTPQAPGSPGAASPSENFDVSVQAGRLHFTAASWNKLIEANRKEENQLLERIHKLSGFISLKKIKNSSNKTANAGECNCDVDDDLVYEIADAFYMFDIDDWTVKIDACNQKFIAIDRLGFSPDELTERIDNLRSCRYTTGPHLFEYTFDDELSDKLTVERALLNGQDPPEALLFCTDVACGDRSEVSWEDPGISVTPVGSTKPITIDVSRVYLRHNKKILKSDLVIWIEEHQVGDLIPMSPDWQVEYGQTDYKGRCGNTHSHSPGDQATIDLNNGNLVSHDTEGPRKYILWEEYHGKHLKAGYGSWTARVMDTDFANGQVMSSWITIVF